MTWDGKERRKVNQNDETVNDIRELRANQLWIKRILIGSLSILLSHMGAGIWWAATVSTKIDYLQSNFVDMAERIEAGSNDRYRGSDATRDFRVVQSSIDKLDARVSIIEQRVWTNKGVSQ